jgi:D-sedoheptulose 7-phosphate isomerase
MGIKSMQILGRTVRRHPDLEALQPEILRSFEILAGVFRSGKKLLVCGNGGSAADSEHIVAELIKGYISRRPVPGGVRSRLVETYPERGEYLASRLQGALPAISLVSQVSFLTAFANDVASDMIFAQQVYAYGTDGDALIAISTSGASPSVIHAAQVARALGLHAIGLTGASGGSLKEHCEAAICAPGETTAEIQENHQVIYHTLCEMLETEFFPS